MVAFDRIKLEGAGHHDIPRSKSSRTRFLASNLSEKPSQPWFGLVVMMTLAIQPTRHLPDLHGSANPSKAPATARADRSDLARLSAPRKSAPPASTNVLCLVETSMIHPAEGPSSSSAPIRSPGNSDHHEAVYS
jgi:hypothetical protein